MKQYFIGINKRSKDLIMGLLNLGATLMFRWHPKTMELNKKYEFYDGEWLLVSCSTDETEINDIRNFLFGKCEFDKELKFEIVYHQDI